MGHHRCEWPAWEAVFHVRGIGLEVRRVVEGIWRTMETLVEYIGISVTRPILGRVCQIHGRELYRALGGRGSTPSPDTSTEVLKRRRRFLVALAHAGRVHDHEVRLQGRW